MFAILKAVSVEARINWIVLVTESSMVYEEILRASYLLIIESDVIMLLMPISGVKDSVTTNHSH